MTQVQGRNENKMQLFFVVEMTEGIGLHFSASMLSGVVTAFNSMPFDIAKTRFECLPHISLDKNALGIAKTINYLRNHIFLIFLDEEYRI